MPCSPSSIWSLTVGKGFDLHRFWMHKMASRCWVLPFFFFGKERNWTSFATMLYKGGKKDTWGWAREGQQHYMCERKPPQTELSDRGQLMSRYINFMNLHPPPLCKFAATHVLNGSCRQRRLPLCWNKWRGENGVKTTPLRCINLHLLILSYSLRNKKNQTGCAASEVSLQNRQSAQCIVSIVRHGCHGHFPPIKIIWDILMWL